jgi:glycosyltransferase involved in cell wall biosynthesis
MNCCVLIPVYNHEGAMPAVLASLKPFGLPCIVVDDGSSQACASALQGLAARESAWVSLVSLPLNLGKGGAVMAGLKEAGRRGFSHALQIDADGQHQAQDVPKFLDAAAKDEAALVIGAPLFDQGAPKSRLYGRILTNVWIWINSLSLAVEDAMCGFRLYPLKPVLDLMASVKLGLRMDFDPELLVRLQWRGLKVVNIPTKVSYPTDGRSHFRLGLDNWLISRMHARLFFGMLARLPLLLWHKWQARTGADSRSSALPGA